MNINDCWIDVQGMRIHYLQAGNQGSPVVLLHGGGIDSAILSWETVIPALAESHRVYAPDWPGFGDSDRPEIQYTHDFYLRYLADLLDALDLEKPSLVGLSMGGGLALGLALEAPERVNKLVLMDSYGLQASAPFQKIAYLYLRIPFANELIWASMRSKSIARASFKAILHDPQNVTDDLVQKAFVEMNKPALGRAWSRYQKDQVLWTGTRTCYMDRLGEIKTPTLIVQGGEDTLVPMACVREAHARIKGSQLIILEGCGHWPQREKPEEVNRVLVEFLRDVSKELV